MVKLLIYDSCMIVKKETIISIYHDIQVVHKKHDGMIVVFLKSIIVLTNLNRKCRFEGVSKFSPSFFMPKAPTFTSWGFVIT